MEQKVRLSERSLREISMACFEAYPYECSGFLFGTYRENFGWRIHEVHGLQRVKKRSKNGIREFVNTKEKLLEGFSKNNLIWGFHSHPSSSSRTSEGDRDYLRNTSNSYPLELIISINNAKRRGKTEMEKDYRDYVTLRNSLFVLNYRAHYLAENNRIYTAKIIVG